jgi:hypothetical protein
METPLQNPSPRPSTDRRARPVKETGKAIPFAGDPDSQPRPQGRADTNHFSQSPLCDEVCDEKRDGRACGA